MSNVSNLHVKKDNRTDEVGERQSKPGSTQESKFPIRLMTQDQKNALIHEYEEKLEVEKDAKIRMVLRSKLRYIKNSDQKKKKRRERYLQQNKDKIVETCRKKIATLQNVALPPH